MSAYRVTGSATIGPYTFEQVDPKWTDGLLYWRFRIAGRADNCELFDSLERALVSAVGEKLTDARGAGGRGVGTLADWFMAACRGYEK